MKYIFSILIVLFSFGGFAQDTKKIKNDSLLTSLDSLDINPDSVKQKIIGLIIKSDFLLPAYASIGYNFGYSLTIEKLIKKRSSIQLTGNYLAAGITKDDLTNTAGEGAGRSEVYQVIAEYKYFITKQRMLLGQPYVGISGGWWREEDRYDGWIPVNINYQWPIRHYYSDYYFYSYAVALITGYQFYLKERLVIDFLIGFGKSNTYSIEKIGGESFDYSNGKLKFGLRNAINVGYKF